MFSRVFGKFDVWALTLLRVVTGFLFWQHGAGKLFGLLGGDTVEFLTLRWFAGVLEFFGGLADAALVRGCTGVAVGVVWQSGRAVHRSGSFPAVGRDGLCLLHFSRSRRILADSKQRRESHIVLLYFPLPGHRWWGTINPGWPVLLSRLRGRRIGGTGLSPDFGPASEGGGPARLW